MNDRIALLVTMVEKMVAVGWNVEDAIARLSDKCKLSDEQTRLVKNWYTALVS